MDVLLEQNWKDGMLVQEKVWHKKPAAA
jgi:hypothetical protein